MVPEFEPRTADYADWIGRITSRSPFMQWLGVEIGAVEPGRVELLLTPRAETTQHRATVHGAVIAGVADNAAGAAGGTLTVPEAVTVTVEYKINFLRPPEPVPMRAIGQVLAAGRSLIVARCDVYPQQDGTAGPCAILLGTFRRVPMG